MGASSWMYAGEPCSVSTLLAQEFWICWTKESCFLALPIRSARNLVSHLMSQRQTFGSFSIRWSFTVFSIRAAQKRRPNRRWTMMTVEEEIDVWRVLLFGRCG